MTTAWQQVPLPPSAHQGRKRGATLAIGLWIACIGPVARAWALPAGRPIQVAAAGIIGTFAVLSLPRRWWLARLVVAAACGAALYSSQGEIVSVWLAVGLVLAPWVAHAEPPLPFLPAPGAGVVPPVLALTAVAAWLGADEPATWQPFVPLALASSMPLLTRLGHGRLDRAAAKVGRAVGNGVAALGFGLLGFVAVLLPWAVHRLLRFDPLDPRPGWAARERRPVRAASPWTTEAAAGSGTLARRFRIPTAIGLVGLVLLSGLWLYRRAGTERLGDGRSGTELLGVAPEALANTPAAQRQSPWYPNYVEDITWGLDEKVGLRPFELYRLWDFETRTVNVHGGDRDSWTPPACDCRRVTVWLYGGNAAFGFEQRDEHTIASELARAALADGITLDVVNRGLPGQLLWRQATRFGWDTVAEDSPDLAVFYGGAEEVESAEALNDPPSGDMRAPYEPFVEDLYDEIQDITNLSAPATYEDAVLVGRGTGPKLSDPAVGVRAVERYDRSRKMVEDTAEATGVPVRYAWQPTRYNRPEAEATIAGDPAVDRRRAATFAAAADALPDDVLDLTDVFQDVEQPLFITDVAHNELGARLVARALYRNLRSSIRTLASKGGS